MKLMLLMFQLDLGRWYQYYACAQLEEQTNASGSWMRSLLASRWSRCMPGRNHLHILFHLLASRLSWDLSNLNVKVSKKKVRTRNCGKMLRHVHHMQYVSMFDGACRIYQLVSKVNGIHYLLVCADYVNFFGII